MKNLVLSIVIILMFLESIGLGVLIGKNYELTKENNKIKVQLQTFVGNEDIDKYLKGVGE